MGWSDDHFKAIKKLERAAVVGGLFALAMPRGSGKTSLAEAAALWAILYGYRRFVVLIGATDEAACEIMDSIKMAIETSPEIGEDFPEACHPIRKMEGINNRASGQILEGERTRVTWTANEAVFPTIKGAKCSGSRIRVAGITGRIRGMKAATADGKTIRPDFAVADDPQTDQSAVSIIDIGKRERRLLGAVKGLAGPGKTIAMFVPCTVIAPRDLSDRILDRDRNPQFQGEKCRMVYAFPTNRELWEQYADIRRESLRSGDGGRQATEFYRGNREAMDAGAIVAWAARFDSETELSAIQAAMNLFIDNPREFHAEYQNEPEDESLGAGAKFLDASTVTEKLSGIPRYEVPGDASRLTGFIDVGGSVHWFALIAWDERFNGSVIDYGCWPRQNRNHFAASDARPTLAEVNLPGMNESQLVFAGLSDLTNQMIGRKYFRQAGGSEVEVDRILIDSGWNTDTVHQFCRQSPHSARLHPSKGVGRSATSVGVARWKPRPGEKSGIHWRLTAGLEGKKKSVQFDPDHWKSFVWERFLTPPGGGGCLSLFGRESGPHAMIGEHCAAEYASPVTIKGDTFDKWEVRPDRPDNHLFDVVVGATVAASVEGLLWSATGSVIEKQPPKPKIKLSELQAQKRQKAGLA